MRQVLFMLLFSGMLAQLYAQNPPSNDNCGNALQIELKTPASCPATSVVTDTFTFSNAGATPADPYPAPGGCNGPESAAEVWFRLVPNGNDLRIQIQGGLDTPHAILFEGTGCENMYPVACASGTGSLQLEAIVDPNRTYFLMVSGGDTADQGTFQMAIRTTNDCFSCVLERRGHFVFSPALENGALPGGEPVQICYVVTRWNASATGELIHALELEFGDGWDMQTFTPAPPASCSPLGNWGWYENWVGSANGGQFGPGFAFDSANFGFLDGNPGNNRGMGGAACSNIGISAPPLAFCWTITPKDCHPEEYGHQGDLSITARMFGDGASGSWGYTDCLDGTSESMHASIYCPDPLAPTVTATNAGCSDICNGSLTITGGGEGPWNYLVGDTTGNTIYQSFGATGTDTVPGLCAGLYNVVIYSIPAGEIRHLQVTVGAGQAPQASATYELPCMAGEPIYLYGSATPAAGAAYSWTGPNGFTSNKQNPLAVLPGTYTLVVTANGCTSEPFILEIPPIEGAVVNVAEDTISACAGELLTITATGNANLFTWYDVSTAEVVGTGPTLTVEPVDGAVYRVTGMNDAGCSGFDEVTVIVPFTPVIESDAAGILCPGEEAVITVSDGEIFEWSTGDSTASIIVTPLNTSIYYATVTGSNGCVANLSITVQVSNPASLFISPDVSLCAGETVSLFASGGMVEWSTGETGSTITVTPEETTTYTAAIRDNNGCEHTLTVTVTVSPAPDLVLTPHDTATICQGQPISLQAFVADTLFWDTLVTPMQNTTYAVPGAADLGCLSLGGFTILVNPAPHVSIAGDTLICGTDSLLLTAAGDGDLLWSTGDTSSSIYVVPVDTAVYSVTATNAFGCQASDSIQVVQSEMPDAPVVNCQASLGGLAFSWAVDTSLSYSISIPNNPMGTFIGNNQYVLTGLDPGQSVTIELTAANAAGCSATTVATCSAPDCSILEIVTGAPDAVCSDFGLIALFASVSNGSSNGIGGWSGPGVDPVEGTFDPAVAGTGAHELVYTYSEAGCTVHDTLLITVEQPLDASMVDCEPGSASVVFSWPALPQDTAYEVIVLSGQSGSFSGPSTYQVDGLVAGDTVVIQITALGSQACGDVVVTASCVATFCPSLVAPADTFVCLGRSVVLAVDPTGWDDFKWAPGVGLSCNDCPNPTATPVATTTYTLIAYNNAGCTDTATVTVYVNTFPPEYLPDEPVIYCLGDEIDICLPDGDIYLWLGPNGFLSQEQCLHFDSATAENTGPYYGLLWKGGCRIYKRIELKMAIPIEVNSITDFVVACADSTFTLAVDADYATSFLWSPGEYLDCPDCPVTTGSLPQTTTFTLTMTDDYGCTATGQATVFVEDCDPQPLRNLPKAEASAAGMYRLRFYPNPARTNIQVQLPAEGWKALELLNTSGKAVLSRRTADSFAQLPVENLPAGSYLLRVITDEGVFTDWVVVVR